MKIILSRKGFDSSNGGIPSPILPDRNIVSLPIPASHSAIKLSDINVNGYEIDDIISDLSKKKISQQQYVHLDPDVDHRIINGRPKGWRGAFGQVGAAQKHLSNNGVDKGDLFIYFGWFREVEKQNQVWRFKQNSPNLHVIYGWLLVEDIISVYGKEKEILEEYPWLKKHPHMSGTKNVHNTIYIGSHTLPSEISPDKPGFGVFRSIRNIQILTDTTQRKRSLWKLPASFYPKDNNSPLSYHARKDRWKILNEEWVTLSSVARGQEFVLNTKYYPGINIWLKELFC